MASKSDLKDIFHLLNELCINIAGRKHKEALKFATQFLSAHQQTLTSSNHLPYDETTLLNRIAYHLNAAKPYTAQNDFILFTQINEKLAEHMDTESRKSILTFLLCMADSNSSICSNNNGLQLYNLPSTLNTMNQSNRSVISGSSNNLLSTATTSKSTINENYFFIRSEKDGNPNKITSLLPKTNPENPFVRFSNPNRPLPSPSTSETLFNDCSSNKLLMNSKRYPGDDSSLASESELVQEAIYSFTGVSGKYLKKDVISGGFKIDPKSRNLYIGHAGMLLRLSELGYYHDQLQSITDSKTGRGPLGLLGQGMVTALQQELTQYYGFVAVLQEQVAHQTKCDRSANGVTLLKLNLWSAEPMHRLQWLTTIAGACQEKKGGPLASTVFQYQYNGDPSIKSLARQFLLAICGPLKYMLSKWLLEGEIDDPYLEFFIEALPDVGPDRLWNDKYRVREIMLPCFITKELANKILVTGKSINFLREVCQDSATIRGREELRKCFETDLESLYAPVPDTTLHTMIDTVYLNTSKKVLDIVMGTHKLLEHLQAMRKYLLLGQGDFIGLLMDNLKPKLDRPARDLFSYELSSILESVMRSTNGQHDDLEVLNHLDVQLMGHFEGDLGWDIFSLQYTVRGPLATMLEPSMNKYKLLFKPLWKMKHLEFVLSSKIWKDQICNAKLLKSMQSELKCVTSRLHLFTSEMIHFVHQIQYYILFEVIECSWTEMLNLVRKARALDDVLAAHESFLRAVKLGAFLDNQNIYNRLNLVYDSAMHLENWQNNFYAICFKELAARQQLQHDIDAGTANGRYGINVEQRLERDQALKTFGFECTILQKTLEKIGTDYEYAVRQFLLVLASSTNHNMQLFGVRLDFNDYYKKRDQSLDEPLTFESIRMSNIKSGMTNSMQRYIN